MQLDLQERSVAHVSYTFSVMLLAVFKGWLCPLCHALAHRMVS